MTVFNKIAIFTIAIIFMFMTHTARAQTCSPAHAGLVSWWQGENNALDSRSLNNGTLQNGATFASGKVGQAFNLDGVDDFIRVNASASLNIGTANGYTIEAWVNPQSNNGEPIVEFDSTTTVGVHLWTSVGGANNLFAGLNSSIQSSPEAVPLNQFSHVAVTYDKLTGLAQLFVNGVIVQSSNVGIGVPATAFDMNIGGRTLFGLDKFHGTIDELSIYDRTLSLSEIQAIFNAGTAGKCKPTATVSPSGQVGWWSGDGNTNDISGNNRNGTLNDSVFAVGKVGQSFDPLDDGGIVQGIQIADDPAFNVQTFTIEAWVTAQQFDCQVSCAQFIVTKSGTNDTTGYEFGTVRQSQTGETGGALRFTINGALGGADLIDDVSIADGNFHHVVASYDGTTMKIFLDGALAAQKIDAETVNYQAGSLFVIGSREFAGSTFPYNGLIDEVSFYNRALTQDEITSIFNAGIAGKLKQNATINSSSSVSIWQGEGNANDTRGANNGTLINGTTFASGRFGQAFQFGNTQHVEVPDSSSLDLTNAITLETWVSPQQLGSAGNNTTLLFKGNIGILTLQSYGMFYNNDGTVTFRVGDGSTTLNAGSGRVLPLNSFSHIVASYDGTTVSFYVNGVLTNSFPVSIGTIFNSTNPLIIGSNAGTFVGKMDEVAIYNRALSPTEVRANYEAGNALSTAVGDARVTFPTVSTAGITQQIPLDLSTLPGLPLDIISTGLAYDIATTATFTGTPTVCFNLPSFTPAQFAGLGVAHFTNGNWTIETALTNTYPILCTKPLASLSPFAIVRLAPTAANVSVSGRVTTSNGQGLRNARLTLTSPNGARRTAITSTFGYYAFDGVEVGHTYVLEIAAKKHTFANPTRIFSLQDHVTDMDFTAEPQ